MDHAGPVHEPDAGDRPAVARVEDDALAATVHRLRDEIDGLHRAMRSRSVIEQAKGMLMERHGVSVDEAFDRLSRLSQHANVKLVDVASALVGVAGSEEPVHQGTVVRPPVSAAAAPTAVARPSPADVERQGRRQLTRRWPRQGSGDGEFGARVRALGDPVRVRSELLAARSPQDVLDTVLPVAAREHPVEAVVIAVIGVDGVVSTIASHGVAAPVAARWRTVPIDLPHRACATARTGQTQWLNAASWSRESGDPLPELGLGVPQGWGNAAVLALQTDAGRIGVLVVTWRATEPLGSGGRRYLEDVAAGVAVAVRRLLVTERGVQSPGAVDANLALLDALLHPLLVCEPVLDSGQEIIDLRLVHANPAALDPSGRRLNSLAGRTLLELWPDAASGGLFAACVRVLENGTVEDLSGHWWRVGVAGRHHGSAVDVRVTRYRHGVLITWTPHRTGVTPLEQPRLPDGARRHGEGVT